MTEICPVTTDQKTQIPFVFRVSPEIENDGLKLDDNYIKPISLQELLRNNKYKYFYQDTQLTLLKIVRGESLDESDLDRLAAIRNDPDHKYNIYRKYFPLRGLPKSEDALEMLLLSNIGLVVREVKKHMTSDRSFEDMVQSGITGLIYAFNKFDPKKKCSTSTYASYWIRQFVINGINKEEGLIRTPLEFYKSLTLIKQCLEEGLNIEDILNRPKICLQLKFFTEQELTCYQNPETKLEDRKKLLQKASSEWQRYINIVKMPLSLDNNINDNDKKGDGKMVYNIFSGQADIGNRVVENEVFAKIQFKNLLDIMDKCLLAKEMRILILRADGLTYEEIGDRFGQTRERMRQIAKEAREKLFNNPEFRGYLESQ